MKSKSAYPVLAGLASLATFPPAQPVHAQVTPQSPSKAKPARPASTVPAAKPQPLASKPAQGAVSKVGPASASTSKTGVSNAKTPKAPVVAPTAAPAKPPVPVWLDDEETVYDLTFTLQVGSGSNASMAAPVTVYFDHQDDQNTGLLHISNQGARLTQVVEGKATILGRAAWPVTSGQQLVLQRRSWGIQLIANNQTVMSAFTSKNTVGKAGALFAAGWSWRDHSLQPVEEISWADDFTRLPNQSGEWRPDLSANWSLTSSSEDFSAGLNRHHDAATRVAMSTNPFAYRVNSMQGMAVTRVGRPFWDNYEAGVSVKPLTPGVIGLAVYYQNDRNYLALLWSSQEGPAARQLVRVLNGKKTVLQQAPGAYLPRQWYRLNVATSPGFITASIDDTEVFSRADNALGRGPLALLGAPLAAGTSAGKALPMVADFDDVKVRSHFAIHGQPSSSQPGSPWEFEGGRWMERDGVVQSLPFPGEKRPTRFALTGVLSGDGYILRTQAKVAPNGAAGLVAGYRDPFNFVLFRWAGKNAPLPFKGRQQLVRYFKGKGQVLLDAPLSEELSTPAGGYAPLSVRMAGDEMAVYHGDRLLAQTADAGISPGKLALWSQGNAPALFKNTALTYPPQPVTPRVTPRFTTDDLMKDWSTPGGDWTLVTDNQGARYWNNGDYYGDHAVQAEWNRKAVEALPAGSGPAKIDIGVRLRGRDLNTGLTARFEQAPQGLKLAVMHADKVLKESTVNWTDISAEAAEKYVIRVRMRGDTVVLFVGDVPRLAFQGSGATSAATLTRDGGLSLTVAPAGIPLDNQKLMAWGAQRNDYTFTDAPTDWYSPQGDWTVFSTWPCYADWSFFGGQGVAPVLWTKRTYSGDLTAEMYVHPQMDLPGHPGYSRKGDLNITLGGDGKNLTSGYSFVVAGWDNTRSRILKGQTMVAENTTEAAWFQNAHNGNNAYHRHWFHVQAQATHTRQNNKDGVRLRLIVDGNLLCDYFDASPLPALSKGGRVALWTVDHGMMIARAKIESSNLGPMNLPRGLMDSGRVLSWVSQPIRLPSGDGTNVVAPIALAPREMPAPTKLSAAFTLPPASRSETAALPVPVSAVVAQDAARTWTVTNPQTGGVFKTRLTDSEDDANTLRAMQVRPGAILDLDMRPNGSLVDLYAVINGVPYLIPLTGGEAPQGSTLRTLPKAILTDGEEIGWKHLRYNLGEALQNALPNTTSWLIQELSLGTMHGDVYKMLGFGGNAMGSSYQLRNITLNPGPLLPPPPATNTAPPPAPAG